MVIYETLVSLFFSFVKSYSLFKHLSNMYVFNLQFILNILALYKH
jgi:hypothetical protein